MKKNSNLKRVSALLLLLALVIVIAGCSARGNNISGNAAQGDYKEIQEVHVSIVGASYVFEPTTLRKGAIVKLIFDMNTVDGCARSIVIPAFGIQKTLSEGNNVVTFSPDKTGEFSIACSMNMYRGSFTVE